MSIKKLVIQLEKQIYLKFPEYNARFCSNRRSNYIHMGLDSSLFGYTNFKKLLDELDFFLNEYLPHQFISVFPPKLIHSKEWHLEMTTNIFPNMFQMT